MEHYKKWILPIIMLVLLVSVILTIILISQPKRQTLHFSFFSESAFSTETEQSYQVIDQAIQRFEANNPNVDIVYTTGLLKDDYLDYLNSALLGDETPDVMLLLSQDMSKYISFDILEDLTPYLENRDQYYDCALDAGSYEGVLYGLPFEIDPTIMTTNEDLLSIVDTQDSTSHWTTQEFYDLSAQLMELGYAPIHDYTWSDAADTFAPNLFAEDGSTAFFDSPEFIEALHYVYNLNMLVDDVLLSKEEFENGTVACMPMEYSQYLLYKKYPYSVKNYVNFHIACRSMPQAQPGNPIATIDASVLSMSNSASDKELAYSFIEFLSTDTEIQSSHFLYSSGVSPIRQVITAPETADILNQFYDDSTAYHDLLILDYTLENSYAPPKFAKYSDAILYANTQVDAIFSEQNTLDIYAKILQKNIVTLLTEWQLSYKSMPFSQFFITTITCFCAKSMI